MSQISRAHGRQRPALRWVAQTFVDCVLAIQGGLKGSVQRGNSTAFEAAPSLVAHSRSLSRARGLLQKRVPARKAALAPRPIWPAERTVSLDPNKIPCRSLVPAQKRLSSPFGSKPSKHRGSDPRIVGRGRRASCPTCSRLEPSSPSAGSAPRQQEHAVSIPGDAQEVLRLRRPPANNRVTSEKASKRGGENPRPH